MAILRDVISRIDTLTGTALGMITALAWNSAFQDFFKKQVYLKSRGPWIYAILITIFAVLYITLQRKLIHRLEDDPDFTRVL